VSQEMKERLAFEEENKRAKEEIEIYRQSLLVEKVMNKNLEEKLSDVTSAKI
jgi:hypothetical protein